MVQYYQSPQHDTLHMLQLHVYWPPKQLRSSEFPVTSSVQAKSKVQTHTNDETNLWECINPRQLNTDYCLLLYDALCVLVKCTEEWNENLLEPSSVTWTIIKDPLQCLRASATLHESKLNTVELHVKLHLLYCPS